MTVRSEDLGHYPEHQVELVGSSFGKDTSLDTLTLQEAPEWISGNSVQTGIILGYGYKSPFITIAPGNETAFDSFARDAYRQAVNDPDLMHHLRNGFARGRSLLRTSQMDDSVKRVIQAYKTTLPASE